MAKVYTSEITSGQIPSDNPIHQRLFKAYIVAENYVKGNVLEVGCGTGRGIELILPKAKKYTAVDKIAPVIEELQRQYPAGTFKSMNIPPLEGLEDNQYDVVVSFQVIEHIRQDALFLSEIRRVLKPGGLALITTPNRKMTLSRNPWHVREYLAKELEAIAGKIFSEVHMKGITGNAKVMAYYDQNKKSVQRIMQYDFLNLQYRLPAFMLKFPYEVMNRWNRKKLQHQDNALVLDIHHDDYFVVDDAEDALDLLLIVRK